ncbi:uncharacterized protein PGTG_05183 [Puccinia graminis f. sp. tritici CRL 75-36-700-3]|uniref:Uncharacterized protein n=2 Tax=Puccinia graminis f. sp. tritici TaxID=56615 RepID=E3K6Z9_PUCGT|nr:uncharacterized protein PGTG_05183 [Puccinia graminis f. sp. tritici CRL 75-36-700-3]EFP79958.2 hypothetical protein PGTG_05183 [Puccinia graminis f. sp. tritici CRL 75-36-700-3]
MLGPVMDKYRPAPHRADNRYIVCRTRKVKMLKGLESALGLAASWTCAFQTIMYILDLGETNKTRPKSRQQPPTMAIDW